MAFRNQPLAGNTLVRAAIQSTPYVAGSVGWSINRDGSAEFNNVAIRGASTAQGVSLYYNGSPAHGNMIASIAPAAGTDAFGNSYPQGIATYNGSGVQTGTWNLGAFNTIDPASGGHVKVTPQYFAQYSPNLEVSANVPNTLYAGSIQAINDTANTVERYGMFGPVTTTDTNQSYAGLELSGGVATDGALGQLMWFNNILGAVPLLTWGRDVLLAMQKTATGTYVQGNVVQSDKVAGDRFIHMADYTVTTNASGIATFNHNASFTPLRGLYSGGMANGIGVFIWGTAYTSTQATVKVFTASGTPFVGTAAITACLSGT